MTEQWEKVKGFEDSYEVSNIGRVKALERKVANRFGSQKIHEKILKPSNNQGYLSVALCKNGKIHRKCVHRLVAEAFIPNPDNKPVVDHIDTNPANNCVDNLRWVTQKENCLNPISRKNNSLSKMGHKCYLAHHTEETKRKMSEIKKGVSLSEEHKKKLSESHMGINKGGTNSLKGKRWKVEGGKRVWY